MNRVLARERTALFLYIVLLVLPAVVFAALLTHRLWRDHQVELAALPFRCQDAARRLADGVRYRLESRLDGESARPFYHYLHEYLDPDTQSDAIATTSTPLDLDLRPEGVLGWYSVDGYEDEYRTGHALLFLGKNPGMDEVELREIAERELDENERWQRGIAESQIREDIEGVERYPYTYRVLAVNLRQGSIQDCRDIPREAEDLVDEVAEVRITQFVLRLLLDSAGEPRLVAERLVHFPGVTLPTDAHSCILHLYESRTLYQGVVLDPVWLFDELPRQVAREVLDPSQTLVDEGLASTLDPADVSTCGEDLFEGLPYEFESELVGPGRLMVATDRSALRTRFRVQLIWLGSVALVLALSMVVGLRLLVGRLRASREEAARTRNFVAAVTHELRTPVAAVKLYGEMLAEGWIRDEERVGDYAQRIVRESDRLSALIDRVLLRRKLQEQPPTPLAGDLNAEVLAQRAELELVGGEHAEDLSFDLAPDLPPVLLVPDGVHVILTNLVENARKYAPVREGGERLLVRTRTDGRGNVLLEVLDRGPGVPDAERKRIFDAFYRPGDERTRATTGTGLGLHIVALQARAMRGKVEVQPRAGGGSVFRVTLRGRRA